MWAVLESQKRDYLSFLRAERFRSIYAECSSLMEESHGTLTVALIDTLRKNSAMSHDEFSLVLRLAEGEYHARRHGKYVQGWLTLRELMEQSTHPAIAQHHAQTFSGCHSVLELCTGSGADTLALAHAAKHVSTIEQNPLYAALMEYNVEQLGVHNITILQGDARTVVRSLNTSQYDGLWADPERRTQARRVSTSTTDYQPPLQAVMQVPIEGRRGIKIAPAITLDDNIFRSQWVREWVGYTDDCREQVLWSGTTKVDGSIYVAVNELEWIPQRKGVRDVDIVVPHNQRASMRYLCEPHPCLIRSGVLQEFYSERSIGLLDEHIAYGVADTVTPHSLLTWFEIISMSGFSIKELQHSITGLGWNAQTEIKKRGIDQTPELLRKQLRWQKTEQQGTIIITRAQPHSLAFYCCRIGGLNTLTN